jgi:hypothetical protein
MHNIGFFVYPGYQVLDLAGTVRSVRNSGASWWDSRFMGSRFYRALAA